jgi:hypothetical protein
VADTRHYVELGKKAIAGMLAEQHALAPNEHIARAGDRTWKGLPHPIDPHHLGTALQELREAGDIETTREATKGERSVPIQHLADLHGRLQNYKEAARRKRALYSRFLGWSQATVRYPRGLVGPAGENVVRTMLREVAPSVGYLISNPDGDVGTLFDEDVPDGPLDSVVRLPVFDKDSDSGIGIWVLIEVKNVRGWIYRDDYRLHQLLHKAAALQNAHPERNILPVLVCRRAQRMTYEMAKAFGFYVADTRAQFLRPVTEVTPQKLFEVQNELGFGDLVFEDNARYHHLLRKHLSVAIPKVARAAAAKWKEVGSELEEVYDQMRLQDLSREDRGEWMRQIFEVLHPNEEPEPEPEAYWPEDF